MRTRPRPRWSVELALRVLGTRFAVRTDDRRLGEALRDLLRAFAVDAAPVPASRTVSVVTRRTRSDGTIRVYLDRELRGGGSSPGQALIGTVAVVNREALVRERRFAVHAGVVATSTGAIAFPGGSGTGKSTLVAAYLQAGAQYVSDEALVLTPSGRVAPYPKPIALSRASLDVLGLPAALPAFAATEPEVLLQPAFLGSPQAGKHSTLAHVVVPHRDAHAATRLRRVAATEAVTALLGCSFNQFRRPAEHFALVTQLASSLGVWQLEYSDARSAAAAVADELGT